MGTGLGTHSWTQPCARYARSRAGTSSWTIRWSKNPMRRAWARRPGSGRVSTAKWSLGSPSWCWSGRMSPTASRWRFAWGTKRVPPHEVEEVIRVWKSHGSLEACQAGYWRRGAAPPHCQPRAQEHHIPPCLVAYLVRERERLDQGLTWRQRKQLLILKGMQLSLPALERVRRAA